MKIQMMNIKDLKPYFRNPRENSPAVDVVAKSLKKFKCRQPIVTDEDLVIIVGHTRYQAFLQLGIKKVPVHVADDLTPEECKAYRIADNKTAEFAGWNNEFLALEFEDLLDLDFDLDETAFDTKEIGKIMATIAPDPEPGSAPAGEAEDLLDRFGGATSIARGSAPLRYYQENDLLTGKILDFGCGQDVHPFARYDMIHQPDPGVLMDKYDTVICNYVLNVQPTDHLIDLICLLLRSLIKPGGKILIALVSEKSLSETPATGNREARSKKEWKTYLEKFFKLKPFPGASFTGFICKPKEYKEAIQIPAKAKEKIIYRNGKISTKRGGKLAGHNYQIGKIMAGKIFIHVNYQDTLPKTALDLKKEMDQMIPKDFEYRTLSWDPTAKIMALIETPDFDSAHEPIKGRTFTLKDGELKETAYDYRVFHHKWQWVADSWSGFDVEEAFARSQIIAEKLDETPRGNSRKDWEKQLKDNGIGGLI